MHSGIFRPQSGFSERWAKIAAIVVLSTVFYRFFDRVAVYHDEIINTAKAGTAHVLDYAMRPLFYAINVATVEFLGAHPLSISFVMVLFFFVGGIYTYRYLSERFGSWPAVSGVAAYAWLGWSYTVGIAATPHLVPAVFLLAAWFYYQATPVQLFSYTQIVRVALLLWAAVLSHPTAVAFVAPFCLAIGIRLSWALGKKEVASRHFLRHVVTWCLVLASLLLATELLYRADGQSFIESWVGGIDRTSGTRYTRYFQPFAYYFVLIAERFRLVLVSLAVLWVAADLVGLAAHRRRRSRLPHGYRAVCVQAVELLAVVLASLCILSLENWKFERILAGFVPLLSLSLVAVAYAVVQKFAFPRFVRSATAFVLIVCSFWQFTVGLDAYKDLTERRREAFSAFFEQIRNLPSDKVAYVGVPSRGRIPRYPFQAVGKQLIDYPLSIADRSVWQTVISDMRAQGYLHVVLHVSKSPEAKRLRMVLKRTGMQRKATYYNGAYELWELKKPK